MNQCTGSLTTVVDKTEELRHKEEAQRLIQGYQEHYASLEHEKVQVVLEEEPKEEKEVILEEATKEKKKIKKKSSCFRGCSCSEEHKRMTLSR